MGVASAVLAAGLLGASGVLDPPLAQPAASSAESTTAAAVRHRAAIGPLPLSVRLARLPAHPRGTPTMPCVPRAATADRPGCP
ncbi:hypothetical protein GCM10010440_28220 [Kitasatospora cinereorecta]